MRTVGVKLMADVSAYVSNIKRAGMSTKDFLGNLDQAARKGNLDAVADRAGVAGLALVGMAGYAVKAAADFDKSMSAVSAATHASQGDLEQLRAAALQAGKDTAFSATEAADGITELSKAGVSTADVLNGGLKGALSLAAAGQISVGEAAETAASAMTQFKLKGDQIPHVADLLAAGAGKAQGSVHDMGAALNQSGLVAAQFGLSIEDTTGALAEFASAGLLGSDAGTSLKTMLLAIANPSKQTRDLMDSLGISFYDASGKFIGLSGVAQVLQTRMKGLTDAQRQQALGQIFGNDAIRAASILYTDGAAGADKWKKAVNDSGFAADTAAKLTDNLAGDIERLKGSVETLAIEAGGGGSSGLRVLAQALNAVVNGLVELPPVVSEGGVVLVGLAGTALLLGSGWVKLRSSTTRMLTELREVGPVGVKAASGLETTSKYAGRATAAFIGLQAVGAIISSFMTDLNPQTDAAARGLAEWNQQAELGGEAARLFGKDGDVLARSLGMYGGTGVAASISHATDATTDFIFGLGGVSSPIDDAKERVQAFDQALVTMVNNGNATKAADLVQDMATRSGISITQAKQALPGYAAALDGAGSAASGAASKTGDLNSALKVGANAQDKYATAADAAAGAARGEADALSALSLQLKAETDPVFGLLEAEHGLAQAQKDSAKAIKEHGRNSEEAKEATRKLALAAIDLTGKAGALGNTFNGEMTPALRQTLQAAGLTKAQIADVAHQFRDAKHDAQGFAQNWAANVSAPGAAAAGKQIRTLKQELTSMKTNWNVTIRQNFQTFGKPYSPAGVASGNVGGLAAGGPVYGPGTTTSDSVPMMLSRGEHVWTAAEVQAAGGQDAVARMRSSVLASRTVGPDPAPRMMPAAVGRGTVTTTVIEHRVVFDGAQGELGQLVLKAIRTSPGIRESLKQRIGV